jgi:hypothetical protein
MVVMGSPGMARIRKSWREIARERQGWPEMARDRRRLPCRPNSCQSRLPADSSPQGCRGTGRGGEVSQGRRGVAGVCAVALAQAAEGVPVVPDPAVAAQAPRPRRWLGVRQRWSASARDGRRPLETARGGRTQLFSPRHRRMSPEMASLAVRKGPWARRVSMSAMWISARNPGDTHGESPPNGGLTFCHVPTHQDLSPVAIRPKKHLETRTFCEPFLDEGRITRQRDPPRCRRLDRACSPAHKIALKRRGKK